MSDDSAEEDASLTDPVVDVRPVTVDADTSALIRRLLDRMTAKRKEHFPHGDGGAGDDDDADDDLFLFVSSWPREDDQLEMQPQEGHLAVIRS